MAQAGSSLPPLFTLSNCCQRPPPVLGTAAQMTHSSTSHVDKVGEGSADRPGCSPCLTAAHTWRCAEAA